MTKEEYWKDELDRTLKLIKHYHNQKLEYKKLFVTAISVALTITMVILNFPGPKDSTSIAILNKLLPSERLIGIVLVLQGFIGFFVAKTLASLRVAEVIHHNTYVTLTTDARAVMSITNIPLPQPYSNLNRGGADYLSLLAVSLGSGLFTIFGVCLTADTFIVSNWLVPLGVAIAYLVAHCKIIEATLDDNTTTKR